MGPGPSDVSPRVLEATARPTIGHLDPAFVRFMEELKRLLRYAFRTENPLTMPISGPGSVGMETCFVNLVEPGDTVIVCVNGVFGGRMQSIVERCDAVAVVVEDDWGRAVDPEKVERALIVHPEARILAFVHAETSTGARSDAKTLIDLAHAHDCLVIVDAVTSLGGIPLEVDGWDIDAVYSGSQKCLSCTPGLSPVSFGSRALEMIKSRKTPIQSWFMDVNLVMGYWGTGQNRSYHHTAPVNALYGLHESLVALSEEGIEESWNRHRKHHLALAAGFEALGLDLVVSEAARLPQLNVVTVPDGIDESRVRNLLLEDFQLEVGAGLGVLAGKVWRIGLMGHSCNLRNVLLCLTGFETVLAREGAAVRVGIAEGAALDAFV